MNQKLRIIISTGGTGGHIFPALAVAHALKHEHNNLDILFVGAKGGKEEYHSQQAGLQFHGLAVKGIKGKGIRGILSIFSMLKVFKESFNLLTTYKPHAVIGFGNYASFTTVLVARLCGVTSLIHEQNVIPGSANYWLGKIVNRICLSLPDTNNSFPIHKCILTGNPVREDIALCKSKYLTENLTEKDTHNLLIMGGSLGATALNSLVIELLSTLRDTHIIITHQCGEKDYIRVKEAYKSHGFTEEKINSMLFPFIENMAQIYAKTDLALCRAGASTIAELTTIGIPAIFIPFPYAIHNHQTKNASILVEANAAYIFQEHTLHADIIKKCILALLQNPKKREHMAKKMHSFAKPNAAKHVALIILETIEEKEKKHE